MNKFLENIIYYCWDLPKTKYRSIKHWFYCNFNKYHWNLLKKAWCSYPWDGGFLLDLEEAQIDKQIHWFEHHQIMIDSEYEQIRRTLRWAKHCVHVMNNDSELFHFDGEMKFKDFGSDEEYNFKELDTSELVYHYDGPKVNFRNASRFMNESTIELAKKMPNELYVAKCRHLYYALRAHYTEYWWD